MTLSRNPKNPLRPLLEEERQQLIRFSRGQVIAARSVARAKALLAIADGHRYTDAARSVGRRSGDAVASLVARFNTEGLAAIGVRQGGGHRPPYSPEERERLLVEARRVPDRERDGTARWSLSTWQGAWRRSGLPQVSTDTIRQVLVGAGLSGQTHRSWCERGGRNARASTGVKRSW